MSETKSCKYWPSKCSLVNEISEESAENGKIIKNKFCLTSEEPYECPAFSLNERIYKPLNLLNEDAEKIEDKVLQLMFKLVLTSADIFMDEYGREKARELGVYKAIKRELLEIAKK